MITNLNQGFSIIELYYFINNFNALNELSIKDWMVGGKIGGFSKRNKKFFKQRNDIGNTDFDLKSVKYNSNTGDLNVIFNVIPTFLNKINPNNLPKELLKKDGTQKFVYIIGKDASQKKALYYTVQIQFKDIRSFIIKKWDWLKLNKKDKLDLVQDMIANWNDVRFFSNDMSFLYQGVWKRLDELGASIYSFPDLPDKNIWQKRHDNKEFYLTKHLVAIFEYLPNYDNAIQQEITKELMNRKKI